LVSCACQTDFMIARDSWQWLHLWILTALRNTYCTKILTMSCCDYDFLLTQAYPKAPRLQSLSIRVFQEATLAFPGKSPHN